MTGDYTTLKDRTTEPQLQLNSRLLPALVFLFFLLQLTVPFRGWAILLAALGGGWLIGYLWVRSLARSLRLTREMRFGWAQVGDRLQERFTLYNDGWAPALWVELIDHSTLPDYQASVVRYVGGWGKMQWQTDGICTRRGLFTLGPTSLRTGDPFGIYTLNLHYADSMALLVTPPLISLPAIDVAPGGRAGEGQRVRVNPLERTVSAAGVREYRPGDSLHWIHWRISAHHDDLFVRLFDNTPASDWWLVLDLDQRVQAGMDSESTEEHGVMLAASLADRGLRSGRAVGLVMHGEEMAWLPPQGGDSQRLAILHALALATPGTRTLAELLRDGRSGTAAGQRASLVIITPNVTGDWAEGLFPLLQRGVTPTVLLLDPITYGGTAGVNGALAWLTDLGVARYVITRDLFDQPETRPGRAGQWEWRVSPTGRVVPVRRPRDLTWRRLS